MGARKGAFTLTSDGKRERWDVSGPHFEGWEIYYMKGSPVDPNRLYPSQLGTCALNIGSFAVFGWDFCTGVGSDKGYFGK